MKKSVLENFSIKNKCLLLTIFVSFSLFVSENVFGYKYFNKQYITVKKDGPYIDITALIYNYSNSDFGFLAECKFEATADLGKGFFSIMEFKTPEQKKGITTDLLLKNKLSNAEIFFLNFQNKEKSWPEKLKASFLARVPNIKGLAMAKLAWLTAKEHSQVYLIRVSGKWQAADEVENFSFLLNLNNTQPNKIEQSDDKIENTDIKEINKIEVSGESDAIVVKGAESGATIKICNQSGVEIKTVVANTDVVKIDLPANQLYLVYVGEKNFKVAL